MDLTALLRNTFPVCVIMLKSMWQGAKTYMYTYRMHKKSEKWTWNRPNTRKKQLICMFYTKYLFISKWLQRNHCTPPLALQYLVMSGGQTNGSEFNVEIVFPKNHPTPYWGLVLSTALIARFMGPTWGTSGADRTQVGLMLAPWTLLSGGVPSIIR